MSTAVDSHRTVLGGLLERPAHNGQAWLQPLRAAGFDRFVERGLPTMEQEAWRYTSFRGLAKASFVAADTLTGAPCTLDALGEHVLPDAWRLVFVDGHWCEALSELPSQAMPLARAWSTRRDVLEAHLASSPGLAGNPFIALNQAFLQDGMLLSLAAGEVLERPIQVLHVASATSKPYAVHPRLILLFGARAQARVVESFVALQEGAYLQNPVVDVVLSQGAQLDYHKTQQEALQAYHVGAIQVRQERDSRFTSYVVSLGGGLVRQDLAVLLGGPGANCQLNGLSMVAGTQHVDHATYIDHAVPQCGSQEVYKTILDDKSTAGFTGQVLVRQDAQKTDAHQTNRTLLLSTDALVNTRPQLQIYADDVKCTHGAAVGQMDKNALFYLMSRGIGATQARSMLTYAFGNEVVQSIPDEVMRHQMQALLWRRLAMGALELV